MNPLLSIFEKGKGQRVVIRPEVRRSVRMYLVYLQMCAVEGGRKAKMNPSWYTEDGRNKMAEYFESAAKYLAGCIEQTEGSYDSRALAAAALSIISGDPALPADLTESVTLGIPELPTDVPQKPAQRRGGSRPDGAVGAGAKPAIGAAAARRVRPGAK